MSRIGKKSINVPSGVSVSVNEAQRTISADGPKGKLSYTWAAPIEVKFDEGEKAISCDAPENTVRDKAVRAHWGTTRSRIQNIVDGVHEGFSKKLEINGVGWNAQPQGKTLRLNVGYCHPVDMVPPDGVEFAVEGNLITITGADKVAVGQFAANVRSKRPPEPYKGKGIKYIDEYIIRKQGKVFGS